MFVNKNIRPTSSNTFQGDRLPGKATPADGWKSKLLLRGFTLLR